MIKSIRRAEESPPPLFLRRINMFKDIPQVIRETFWKHLLLSAAIVCSYSSRESKLVCLYTAITTATAVERRRIYRDGICFPKYYCILHQCNDANRPDTEQRYRACIFIARSTSYISSHSRRGRDHCGQSFAF